MAEMFANALAYEQMMGRWSARLAPLFAEFAQVADGGRLLDVGCGTGSLVKAMVALTQRSEIVGIDPVSPFVDYARTQFTDCRVTFDHGDALKLPYSDGSFDQTLLLLVLMFISKPERAAREMRRVTRLGGTVAACTWHRHGLEMNSVLFEEAVRLDPGAEMRFERPLHSNREGQLGAMWEATGLQHVEETTLEIRMDFSSFDDYWQPIPMGVGPSGMYVNSLPPERREALRQAVRKRFLAERPDGPFSFRAKALAVRGIVPNVKYDRGGGMLS